MSAEEEPPAKAPRIDGYEMTIVDYLDAVGIPWEPVKLKISADGKKVVRPYPSNQRLKAQPRDFEKRDAEELAQRRHKYLDECEHIAHSTAEYPVLDIDDRDKSLYDYVQDVTPFYVSSGKGKLHAFIAKSSLPLHFTYAQRECKRIRITGADILKGMWAFAPKDAVVRMPREGFAELRRLPGHDALSQQVEDRLNEQQVPGDDEADSFDPKCVFAKIADDVFERYPVLTLRAALGAGVPWSLIENKWQGDPYFLRRKCISLKRLPYNTGMTTLSWLTSLQNVNKKFASQKEFNDIFGQFHFYTFREGCYYKIMSDGALIQYGDRSRFLTHAAVMFHWDYEQAKAWLDNIPPENVYEQVDFRPPPLECGNNYNEWPGFWWEDETLPEPRFEADDPHDISAFLALINNAAQDDPTVLKFILAIFGQALTEPGVSPSISMTISTAMQGQGKTFLLYTLPRELLRGRNNVDLVGYSNGLENITQRFQSVLVKTVWVLADEVCFKESRQYMDWLKAQITSSEVKLDRKFEHVRYYPNCARIHFVSNNKNPLPITKDDRRFFVLDMGNRMDPGDYAFFSRLFTDLATRSKLLALVAYLRRHAVSADSSFWKGIPQTEFRRTLDLCNEDTMIQWLRAFSEDARNQPDRSQDERNANADVIDKNYPYTSVKRTYSFKEIAHELREFLNERNFDVRQASLNKMPNKISFLRDSLPAGAVTVFYTNRTRRWYATFDFAVIRFAGFCSF